VKKIWVLLITVLLVQSAVVFAQNTSGSQTQVQRGLFQPPALKLSSPSLSLLVAPPNIQLLLNNQDKLQLSDDQKGKVTELLTAAGKTRRTLVEKLSKAANELKPALLDDKFDLNRMLELAETARKAEAELMSADIETWSKLREILTADQIKQLRDILMPPQGVGAKPRPIIPRAVIPPKAEDSSSSSASDSTGAK